MRVLVAAASKHGSTREIGEEITAQLEAMGLDAEYHDLDAALDIEPYEAVIIGSGIYMGNWLKEARQFVETHAEQLARLPVWIFSSGPLGEDAPVPAEPLPKASEIESVVHARDHRIFAGKLDPSDLGLTEKLAVKVVHAPSGDFRPWDAIDAWAADIASQLRTERPE